MYSGIYSIKCKVNNKSYVGSAWDIGTRWKTHLSHLKCKRHHSIKLQRAWDKYGREQFDFTILEEVKNRAILEKREQYWIDFLDTFKGGFNCRAEASVREWFERLPTKEYIVTTPQKLEIKTNKLNQFASRNGLSISALLGVAHYITTHHKNFHCRDASETRVDWESHRMEMVKARPPRKQNFSQRRRGWIITNPDGTKTRVKNLSKFCREYGLNQANMVEVSFGRRRHHKNFSCKAII